VITGESELERAALRAAREREAQLDRSHRRALGVVHTPLPLVRFALTRVEHALRQDFGLSGLDSGRVLVLDPAAGSGLWLAALLARLRGAPAGLIGIDADAAALARARSLLAPAAHRLGVPLSLRSANTLALRDPWPSAALRVIVGNPPWGARSLSRGLALSDAWLDEFRRDRSGRTLGERRSGVLSDDYVRFFRWALEQAREAPCGAVVCLVTNASFLDGPVHRGMRAALAAAFARIEVFDFGGNPRTSRGAEPDEGVFPVRTGAALTLLVRPALADHAGARVAYTRLRGRRVDKLGALEAGAQAGGAATGAQHSPDSMAPAAPWFSFRPQVVPAERDGFSLDQAFPFHREGVQTNRDALATAPTRALLRERLFAIARGEVALPRARHFDPEAARARVARALERDPEDCIGTFWYRPFEPRAYASQPPLCHRPRPDLARAVARSELCLLSSRKEPGGAAWNMFAAVRGSADSSFLSTRSACRTRVFPSHGPDGEPNLARGLLERLGALLGVAPEPVQVIRYALGVLGAPRFRAEHQAALKLDYPRLPWPRDARAFLRLASAGERFEALLAGPPPEARARLALMGEPPRRELRRAELRQLSSCRLQVASGFEIDAGAGAALDAQVGHHRLIELAYRARGTTTLPELLSACTRALMWSEAEKAADDAYLS
jgi:SAM-dependent methyltransferase